MSATAAKRASAKKSERQAKANADQSPGPLAADLSAASQRLFVLNPAFVPTSDQAAATRSLADGLDAEERFQTLLGVTGSGKTATMALTIEKTQRPALVIAHNKTLAAQLVSEFKELFPDNAVEYFVSYYDYYQPEAYVPSSDTFIEKDAQINAEIERLRHSATASLLSRRDVIVVASVSCIYGMGSPESYREQMLVLERGKGEGEGESGREEILLRLAEMQYQRNDLVLGRGSFRARGETIELIPAYSEKVATRIVFFGNEIEEIALFDPLSGKEISQEERAIIWPATHYNTSETSREGALTQIRTELKGRLKALEGEGKLIEAQRLKERVSYDIEMIEELGWTSGIENYSRIFDGRAPGERPYCLLDYFPEDFLCLIDESHQTIPQIGAMFKGDKARKQILIDYGFRLPSALDNRPQTFNEFLAQTGQTILVSATPANWELAHSSRLVEQLNRPTGIVDPEIEVRPSANQIDDLMNEIEAVAARDQRTLVTTLTKKMAERLTEYLGEHGVRVRYLHSDIETLERIRLIRELRLGEFDVLVGVNLLREGLDLPEVSLVAIIDADKEGFLRGETSLIQTIGRAARHENGRVLMYADKTSQAMKLAIKETDRRRRKQLAYNEQQGITPRSIKKEIKETSSFLDLEPKMKSGKGAPRIEDAEEMTGPELERAMIELEEEMLLAAEELRFEYAAKLRDELGELRQIAGRASAGR